MAKSFTDLAQALETLNSINSKTLGLRNRKQKPSSNAYSTEEDIQNDTQEESKNKSEETFLFSSNPTQSNKTPSIQDLPAFNEPPKGAKVFEAYPKSLIEQLEQKLRAIKDDLQKQGKQLIDVVSSNFAGVDKSIQELLSTLSKDEKQFMNGVVSHASQHYGFQALTSMLNIHPATAILLGLALPFIKGAAAQPVPGTDFAIFDGFPPDAANLCVDAVKENLEKCNQFYVTYNDQTVVQSVSKLIKGTEWDKGRIPMQELCVDSFNQCRDQAAMKSIMEKMLKDPNVTKFIDTVNPCFDKSAFSGHCSSSTMFKGLSGKGCSEMLGYNRNTSVSTLTECLNNAQTNVTARYALCKPGDTSFNCKSFSDQFAVVGPIVAGVLGGFCLLFWVVNCVRTKSPCPTEKRPYTC